MAALGVQDSSSLHDYWQIRYPEQEKRPGIHVAGATEPAWWDAVERRLEGLMQLGPNWDSRGSRPANLGDVFAAVQFLTEVMRPETAVPWIGPLSSGGI
ncbi:MAG: hypothetical protein ACRD1T_27495, partial [Acidimicrobiia bacterium]